MDAWASKGRVGRFGKAFGSLCTDYGVQRPRRPLVESPQNACSLGFGNKLVVDGHLVLILLHKVVVPFSLSATTERSHGSIVHVCECFTHTLSANVAALIVQADRRCQLRRQGSRTRSGLTRS